MEKDENDGVEGVYRAVLLSSNPFHKRGLIICMLAHVQAIIGINLKTLEEEMGNGHFPMRSIASLVKTSF